MNILEIQLFLHFSFHITVMPNLLLILAFTVIRILFTSSLSLHLIPSCIHYIFHHIRCESNLSFQGTHSFFCIIHLFSLQLYSFILIYFISFKSLFLIQQLSDLFRHILFEAALSIISGFPCSYQF